MRPVAFAIVVSFALGAAPAMAAAPPAAAPPITAQQYEAIDRLYAALIPLEDKRSPSEQDYAKAVAACNRLGAKDRLLAAVRRSCLPQIRLVRSLDRLDSCKPLQPCTAVYRRIDERFVEVIRSARRENRVIDAAVSDADCRQRLRVTARQVGQYQRLRAAFRLLGRARTQAQIEEATKRLPQLTEEDQIRPQRNGFRVDCNPV